MEDEEENGDSAASSTPVLYGPDDRLVIPFQNENLYASLEKSDGSSKVRLPAISHDVYTHTFPSDYRNCPRSHHCTRFAERGSTGHP